MIEKILDLILLRIIPVTIIIIGLPIGIIWFFIIIKDGVKELINSKTS